MLPYFAMYLAPAVAGFWPAKADRRLAALIWGAVFIAYTLLIGLRHEIGSDWWEYIDLYRSFEDAQLVEVMAYKDSGYAALNWLMAELGLGIYGVNIACAAIFMSGLIAFSRQQPLPWLAFAISVPYIVIVVGMGYTRQAVALGFILWALTALNERRIALYVTLVILAATFHKTALPFLFLPLLTSGGKAAKVFVLSISGTLAYLLLESFAPLWALYIETPRESEGGMVRVLMTAAVAVVFFALWWRWPKRFPDRWIWGWFALFALASVFLVEHASTAVDRVALYVAPLQIVVLSRLPVFFRDPAQKAFVALCTLVLYGVVLYVWLRYASHAADWVPYKVIGT